MLRCLYVDLDGTLLGPGGSLFAGADHGFALDAVRALQACDRAGVEVVIYSGRRQGNVFDAARLLGHSAYIFELGCGLVVDGETEWLTDGLEPTPETTIFDQIALTGAPELLLDQFAGRLEYHLPWAQGREVSHLFRGDVPADEAATLLDKSGLGRLRLVDNGVLAAHGMALDGNVFGLDVDRVHVYHLMPACASKSRAVARHMQNRGYTAAECIAVGDSREDLGAASVVGCFWLVANGLEADPSIAAQVNGRPGVRVCEQSYGAGVYEAVVTTLAAGRSSCGL